MPEVIGIPHGRVTVDTAGGIADVDLYYRIENTDDYGAFVEMALGYLDVLESHGLDTDYVELPIVVRRGLFSRDPGPKIARIERALNAALSRRGMCYDGYAMHKL